ncbi:flavin reductase family protein [Alkalicoccus urumqiensis]|uniref:Flavin reductase like domain-containing protein n=1 Tax=Alkalicoccus urumqiensis TaxID=1548213 RepID=A0A2P6MIK7_ALKUR|nr:flavin reductase family protein [Alkalicoccus urumqiensis]PRO66134.1 hypothetical protein C6I21_04855 [Alkalicoccus urumqiensis]
MVSISSKELAKKDHYRLLTSIVTPRPIALVTSVSKAGYVNAAPFSYFSVISADPPLVSIAVGRRDGRKKDTAANILETGEFVIHAATKGNVKKMNETSAELAPEESEIDRAGFHPLVSSEVSVPSLKESPVKMECRLEKHLEFEGDDGAVDLLIGRILHYEIEDKLYENGRVDTKKMKPVARLGGREYAELGNIFELPRPGE